MSPEPTRFYLSPDGKGDGTLDAPFGTLEQARDAVRALKDREGIPAGGVRIVLRGGLYPRETPFELLPEDSGREDAPVVYEAYPGETPVISGGRRIQGLRRETDGWFRARISDAANHGWVFRQLFVNGQRRTLARSPNTGYFQISEPVREAGGELSKTAFRFAPGDLRAWERPEEVNVILFHRWATSLHPLASVDEDTHTVTLTGPAHWPIGQHEHRRYYVENHPGALDAPGEWQLDRETGALTLVPIGDEDLSEAEVIAPVAEQLLVLQGDPDRQRFVEHVEIRGLSFRHTEWPLPPEGQSDIQAACTVNAVIQARGAQNCTVSDCEISQTGNYGIWFERGCSQNRIVRNHLHDLGAGGIRLGEPLATEADPETAHNTVENNRIRDGGRVHHGAVGIWIGSSGGNRICHNEICDLFYTGISVGWNWVFSRTPTRDNLIAHNHIHHVMRHTLSDGGGIYTLGLSPGTVLRNNHIHDVHAFEGYSGRGIYLDQGCSGVLVENNVVHRTSGPCIRLQLGTLCNVIVNNIFAFGEIAQLCFDTDRANVFEYNILYWKSGKLFYRDDWQNFDRVHDYNLYFRTDGEPIRFLEWTFEEWQQQSGTERSWFKPGNMDRNSVVADPLFVDAENGDFRLRPDSPALHLGFRPIDLESVGPVKP